MNQILTAGDTIETGDEFRGVGFDAWVPIPEWSIGRPYSADIWVEVRRPVRGLDSESLRRKVEGSVMVKLKNGGLEDGRYTDEQGHVWSVARLIQHAKDLPVFEVPVAGIYIGAKVFAESRTARAIAEHVKRVQETDLQYPVLLDPDGFIMDGWHRVVKALVEGRETVLAKRFEELPSWEFQEKE